MLGMLKAPEKMSSTCFSAKKVLQVLQADLQKRVTGSEKQKGIFRKIKTKPLQVYIQTMRQSNMQRYQVVCSSSSVSSSM